MSFNRLKYDSCNVKKYNEETSGAGSYRYDTPIICNSCLNDNPRIINQKAGVSLNGNADWRFYSGPVDVESDLFNLKRYNSRCPSDKYMPQCEPNACDNQGLPCGGGAIDRCVDSKNPLRNKWNRPGDSTLVNFPNCFFPTEDTLLNNPKSTLRGTGWNRFDVLCKDPQEKVFFPIPQNENTRLMVKDSFRTAVVRPNVNDMNPYEELTPPPMLGNGVPGVYTKPMYQYDVCG